MWQEVQNHPSFGQPPALVNVRRSRTLQLMNQMKSRTRKKLKSMQPLALARDRGEEMGNSHDPTPAASATDNGGARLATKSESPASELQCDSRSRSGSNDDRPWRRDRDRRRSPSPPRPPIAAHEPEHKLGRILRGDSQFKLRPANRRARNHARRQLEPPPPPPPEQNWRPRGPAWD